ncbi:deoxyribonuclease-1-like [Stegodyphus dumicola]|uniref:deoxyribonuclease-1-like n=1 Tax=Stegodyphus dumicola TaxID=202533 RepID=UPI0015B1D303|nr:deoxyribonuclease-1-like [Stegodyphus dumicola]
MYFAFVTLLFTLLICQILSESEWQKYAETRKMGNSIRKKKQPNKVATEESKVVERPLHIGSYNIQTLGKKKFQNIDIMLTIEKIISRYDLMLVMEVMTSESHFMEKLLRDVNAFRPPGAVYNMTLSESHPQTKEHCAFFYRVDKLQIARMESYTDPAEQFYRKPFFVLFNSPTLRDMKRFGVIGHHAKPSQVVKELNGLADLYDRVREKYFIEDVLLMGDFNAHCTYVKEKEWENITLWTRQEFTWPIGSHIDTTTNYKSCALDRFVYAGENMNTGVILSSARVFDFRQELDVTLNEARDISDHWPIEIKIRGKMSELAEKDLVSDICFTVQDTRPRNVSKQAIITAAQTSNFIPTVLSSLILLKNETLNSEDMLNAVRRLQSSLSNVISKEQLEAIIYKTQQGSLEDDSSFADVSHMKFKVQIFVTNAYSEILTCKTTTIN